MFSSLMPQRREFFELLAAHADRVVAGANATLRLVDALDARPDEVPALVAEIDRDETSADEIKAQLIALLHRSFTTPINRDQIHTLTIGLDQVINALKDVAEAVGMYNVKGSTPEARELATLAADACMRLSRAVAGLGAKNAQQQVRELCREVDALESQADRVQRRAIGALFDGSAPIWTAIRMREFYSLQEEVLDRCEAVAKTIEEILIENS
jgi:predicted phosphate transport protein (TIGR00153 family)